METKKPTTRKHKDFEALVLMHEQTIEQQDIKIQSQQQKLDSQKHENSLLQERINQLLNIRFNNKVAKIDFNERQGDLFNEAEMVVAEDESSDDTVTVEKHQRKRGKRAKLDPNLEREVKVHDLPEDQRQCGCGCTLKKIGEVSSEQLDIVPMKVRVIKHVRVKYACKQCQSMVTALLPKQPIPKSQVSPGLLAYIMVSKYCDSLPLYRLEKILNRFDADISRASLSRWVIRGSTIFERLLQRMHETLLSHSYLQCDESRLQVLKEKDRLATTLSQMWVMRGGPPGQVIIWYHYATSRGSGVLEALLPGYRGYLQSDGWSAYKTFENKSSAILIGCFAHAIRYFKECIQSLDKSHSQFVIMRSRAIKGYHMIKELYAIEDKAKHMDDKQRFAYRQKYSVPKLNTLKQWIDKTMKVVVPKGLLGKAIAYTHNQWPFLIRYCERGDLQIDNNLDEQAVKHYVIGRKNWCFSDTPAGAHASARCYTIIQTAMANKIEPYKYLKVLFTELPKLSDDANIDHLLPWNIDFSKYPLN